MGDTRQLAEAREVPATGAAEPPAARRADLDAMRSFVVVGLVVFHSAMVFAPGTSWFVTSSQTSGAFTVFLLWGSLWGMPLLFVVSGMGVRYALRTRSPRVFVRERLGRLLIPFLTGLIVLVPPMFYAARLAQPGFDESYWRFWLSFVNVPAIAAGLLPRNTWTSSGDGFDPAHLWFLYVLLVFSLALLPLFCWLRGERGRHAVDVAARFAHRRPLLTVAAAALPVMAVEGVFGPDVDTGGWERLTYLFPFLYGFLIASDARFARALRRSRRPALACAVVASAALLGWAGLLNASGTDLPPGWGALQGLAGWAWLAAILGFAGSAEHGSRPAMRTIRAQAPAPRWNGAVGYANDAVLPFYLLHEPVIVAAAWFIARWQAPAAVQYFALVAVSLATTLALYEVLVRRFRIPRLLLGMKPSPAGRTTGG
ncbi:MAG TPA: acyltransferase family protein [Jatrophihabitans sp.]|nr:acyltransferase family protein [Jatrophihabitans sp.]